MNKKALTWQYLVLILLAILLIIWGLAYYTKLGFQLRDLLGTFFKGA